MNARSGRWWQRHGDVVLVVVGALMVSGKGVIAKLLYRDGIAVEPILLLRAWFSLPLVWAWGLYRIGWARLLGAPAHLVAGAMLAGFASYYAGAWMNFVALTMIDASLERVLLFTYPAMVMLGRALMARRWPPGRVLSACALTYLGVACAVGGLEAGLWRANALGAALVLGSAALFAYYLIANERVAVVLGSVPFIVYASSAAAVALTAHGLWAADRGLLALVRMGAHDLALIVLMTAVTNVVPLFLISASIRRIGAQRAAIVSTIGPPATLVMAAVVLGETLHPVQLFGAGLILAGIVVLEFRRGGVPA